MYDCSCRFANLWKFTPHCHFLIFSLISWQLFSILNFNFEQILQLWYAQFFSVSEIATITKGFELRIFCMQCSYLTQKAIILNGLGGFGIPKFAVFKNWEWLFYIDPFHATGLLLYDLFRGYRKRPVEWNR